MKRKIGVIGSLVWDEIHGRDPLAPPVEEWGGIAYALAGFDAALREDWEIVPLIKVGRDLAPQAGEFLRVLTHRAADARFIEVPVANNRVTLRYAEQERRCERMAGGVPGWQWPELGPMVADLDAVYVNFISGFEMCLGTAGALRHGFAGPIYADFHSLFLGTTADGIRVLRPLVNAREWFTCFDSVQMNEDEMRQIGADPMAVAAIALEAGVSLLNVTLGARGVAYVAAAHQAPVRTARIPAPSVDALDPTGCGDVFGATCFAHMLSGDPLDTALGAAVVAASRNASYRGATGLADHLRGRLVVA
jgi:hypothetical protein